MIPKRNASIPSIFLLAIIFCDRADAQIHKCQNPDGSLTYSQTPCPGGENITNIIGAGAVSNAVDCSQARSFALATARSMKGGADSTEIFDRYGGLDSLSKGAVGLISYVFQYRQSEDVSAERIAALAQSQCAARSFGNISCEELPLSFAETLDMCGAEEDEEPTSEQSAFSVGGRSLEPGSRVDASDIATSGRDEEQRQVEATSECKERIQAEIDRIDERSRSGHSSRQGERNRAARRDLLIELRQC